MYITNTRLQKRPVDMVLEKLLLLWLFIVMWLLASFSLRLHSTAQHSITLCYLPLFPAPQYG